MDSKMKRSLAVDAVALLVYLAVANPAVTGVPVHEWLGIAVFVAFLVHVVQHVDWAADAVKAAFGHPSVGRTGHLLLDALILVAFMVCTVSGLLISGTVLPALGLYADGYFFWNPLHAASAKLLLALLVVHVAAHWRWIANALRKGRGTGERGDARRSDGASEKDA